MKKIITVLVFIFCMLSVLEAAEYDFESTSAGIVKRLTSGDQSIHHVKTRSLSKLMAPTKTRSIKVVERRNGSTVSKMIAIDSSKQGGFVNLKIEFDVNAANIRNTSMLLIHELGQALSSPDLKDKRFIIKGHSDSDGDITTNFNLSLERAIAVKQYLVAHFDLKDANFKVLGYGESLPLMDNKTFQNKQANRRVEIERIK